MTDPELIAAIIARTGVQRWRRMLDPADPAYQPGYRRTALILLGRDRPTAEPAPKPPAYPPLARQAMNAAGAVGRVVKAVVKQEPVQASDEEQARRLVICHACEPHYDPAQDRCRKCGCRAAWKARLATEHCPLALW